MVEETWRAVVLIEHDESKYIDPTIRTVRALGIENIHLMVSPSVRISKQYDVIAHQAEPGEWEDSYSLFRGSMELISGVYSARSDYFLVIRPGVTVWDQLLTYCECTIPKDVVAVWSPLTPDRCFPTSYPDRPTCSGEWGWCPYPVNRDLSTSHCYVMTGHVMTLLGAYLPALDDSVEVSSMVAEQMSRRRIKCYFHLPSLATVTGSKERLGASDFVGVSHYMSQKQMRRRSSRFILSGDV